MPNKVSSIRLKAINFPGGLMFYVVVKIMHPIVDLKIFGESVVIF